MTPQYDAPAIGDPGAGAALVGAPDNPVLYLLMMVAVAIALAGMLVYICEDPALPGAIAQRGVTRGLDAIRHVVLRYSYRPPRMAARQER